MSDLIAILLIALPLAILFMAVGKKRKPKKPRYPIAEVRAKANADLIASLRRVGR